MGGGHPSEQAWELTGHWWAKLELWQQLAHGSVKWSMQVAWYSGCRSSQMWQVDHLRSGHHSARRGGGVVHWIGHRVA